jgi:hypothetical protein
MDIIYAVNLNIFKVYDPSVSKSGYFFTPVVAAATLLSIPT